MNNQIVSLADLHPHPRNYNAHSDAQIARIARSLETFGQVRSIVVWRKTILAGHGVVLAARSLGWETIRADVQDQLTESQSLAYVVADNELARQSDPDQAQLAAILEELQAKEPLLVEAAGYSAQELEALLRLVNPKPPVDSEPQIDRASELQKQWGTATGQLWALGADHRLICGDCTDAAVVARVMGGELCSLVVTDPPYGVMTLGGRRQTHETKVISFIENDDLVGAELVGFLKRFICACPIDGNGSLYVCYGWKSQAEFTQALRESGLVLRATITWVKNVFGLSAKNGVGYRPQTEFIYFATQSEDYNWTWHGGGTQSDAWQIDRPIDRVGNHPTNKPVELFAKCLENSSDYGDLVFDPFAGSGTTGIACHNLGRRARMVEISPAYCAVILERFAQIGVQPELVEAAVSA